jgi:hypothetical protein
MASQFATDGFLEQAHLYAVELDNAALWHSSLRSSSVTSRVFTCALATNCTARGRDSYGLRESGSVCRFVQTNLPEARTPVK